MTLELKSNKLTTGTSIEGNLQLKDYMRPEKGEMTFNLPLPRINRLIDSLLDTKLTPLVYLPFVGGNNLKLNDSLAVMPRAGNLTPSSENFDFASV